MTPEEHHKLDTIGTKVDRLIGAIQGNGGKGLAGQIEENTEKIDGMEKVLEHVQTKEGCLETTERCRVLRREELEAAFDAALSKKGRNRWLVIKDIILGLLGSGAVVAVVQFLLRGGPE